MIRALTRTDTSSDVLWNFLHQFGRIRGVDSFIGVVPVEGEPDAYRVVYNVVTGDPNRSWYKRDLTPAALGALPIVRGGFLARAMRAGGPFARIGLDLSGETTLPEEVRRATACMALPIFEGDAVQEWSFGFDAGASAMEKRDVVQATLTANLLGFANRHLDTLAEVKRLNTALSAQLEQIAALQQSLLPGAPPAIPGASIATSYLTSDQSGGDYFDFFALPGGYWGVLVADVSGHGAAAATITAMLHAILHGFEPRDPRDAIDPASVLAYANRRMVAAGLEGHFVTAFLGVLNPATGVLTYSNAGHNPPRVWTPARGGVPARIDPIDDAATLPLGIMDGIDTPRGERRLERGQTLVLYTDGITELRAPPPAPASDQFGVERLDAAIGAARGRPDSIVEAVHRAMFEHRRAATRDDDQTLVALHVHAGT